MSENILTQIKSQYRYFTKVEKRIADIILNDPQKFVTYPTSTVAQLANVSQGSVNNFSRKFCEDGFSFLKLQIVRCISKQEDDLMPVKASREKDILFFAERKARQDISALGHTIEINDKSSLEKAVDYITDAQNIYIIGAGQSGFVAEDFGFNLTKLGFTANAFSNPYIFSTLCNRNVENDIVIVISSSGQTQSVIDLAKSLKQKGAKLIFITSNKFSDLAKFSDVLLLTSAGNGKQDGITQRARMSQLLLLDSICAYIDWKKLGNKD